MATGRAPFQGKQHSICSSKVLKKSIDWPLGGREAIDPDCMSLVDALLQLDPEKRLGCPKTDHDFEALFNHPFWKDIDFSSENLTS